MVDRKTTVKKSISFEKGVFYRLEKYAKKNHKHRISTATNHLVDNMLDEAAKYHVKINALLEELELARKMVTAYQRQGASIKHITGRTVGQIIEAYNNNNNNNTPVPVVQSYQSSQNIEEVK